MRLYNPPRCRVLRPAAQHMKSSDRPTCPKGSVANTKGHASLGGLGSAGQRPATGVLLSPLGQVDHGWAPKRVASPQGPRRASPIVPVVIGSRGCRCHRMTGFFLSLQVLASRLFTCRSVVSYVYSPNSPWRAPGWSICLRAMERKEGINLSYFGLSK